MTNMRQNYQNKQEINKLHKQRRLKKVVLNTKKIIWKRLRSETNRESPNEP